MDLNKLIEAQNVIEQEANANERLEIMFRRLLRVLGDIRRVLRQTVPDEQGLHNAVLATRGRLVEILRMEGAVLFGAEGEPLDLQRHSVVAVRESGPETPTVLEVECEGLVWESRVIQKAEVIVSQGMSKGGQS